jgi:hypothetical protein
MILFPHRLPEPVPEANVPRQEKPLGRKHLPGLGKLYPGGQGHRRPDQVPELLPNGFHLSAPVPRAQHQGKEGRQQEHQGQSGGPRCPSSSGPRVTGEEPALRHGAIRHRSSPPRVEVPMDGPGPGPSRLPEGPWSAGAPATPPSRSSRTHSADVRVFTFVNAAATASRPPRNGMGMVNAPRRRMASSMERWEDSAASSTPARHSTPYTPQRGSRPRGPGLSGTAAGATYGQAWRIRPTRPGPTRGRSHARTNAPPKPSSRAQVNPA